MTATKAQIRATQKYKKENYSRIPLDVPREYHEKVKEVAKSQGQSVNGFIKDAIDEKIKSLGK